VVPLVPAEVEAEAPPALTDADPLDPEEPVCPVVETDTPEPDEPVVPEVETVVPEEPDFPDVETDALPPAPDGPEVETLAPPLEVHA